MHFNPVDQKHRCDSFDVLVRVRIQCYFLRWFLCDFSCLLSIFSICWCMLWFYSAFDSWCYFWYFVPFVLLFHWLWASILANYSAVKMGKFSDTLAHFAHFEIETNNEMHSRMPLIFIFIWIFFFVFFSNGFEQNRREQNTCCTFDEEKTKRVLLHLVHQLTLCNSESAQDATH